MDKQTNELDRIVIGVREWAVETIMRQEIAPSFNYMNIKSILVSAKELEDFVLRKLPQFLSYLPVKEEIV